MKVMKASDLLRGLTDEQRAEQEKAIESHKNAARQGQRIVMVCPKDECNPRARRFFSSEAEASGWRCPEHGVGVRQPNAEYFGVPTA